MTAQMDDAEKAKREALKEQVFKGVSAQFFLAVYAHTMCLQSESILLRNACGQDLAKAAQVGSMSNAAAGVLGLILNQFGAKLSDAIGRRPFYFVGPLSQLLSGLLCFLNPDSAAVIGILRTLRAVGTTFSGTVMGTAAMRDVFQGEEFGVKMAKSGAVIGIAVMAGPLTESIILKLGKERNTYLALAFLGAVSAVTNLFSLPESVMEEQKKAFDLKASLQAANPLGFLKLYTDGTPAVKKLASIVALQTAIDGKNTSDIGQIWCREHLKMQMESIRNFVMGYGFASMLAGAKLVPYLMKSLSVYGFTTFTNCTNILAYAIRGSAPSVKLFFGALPLMLPGVNAASTSALVPVLNDHMVACGFGIGESTAWTNNLRVLMGAFAAILYGNVYAWLVKRGINPGLTWCFMGIFGAALPQLLLELLVKKSELDRNQIKKKEA